MRRTRGVPLHVAYVENCESHRGRQPFVTAVKFMVIPASFVSVCRFVGVEERDHRARRFADDLTRSGRVHAQMRGRGRRSPRPAVPSPSALRLLSRRSRVRSRRGRGRSRPGRATRAGRALSFAIRTRRCRTPLSGMLSRNTNSTRGRKRAVRGVRRRSLPLICAKLHIRNAEPVALTASDQSSSRQLLLPR
jgi:hypothetical protein